MILNLVLKKEIYFKKIYHAQKEVSILCLRESCAVFLPI